MYPKLFICLAQLTPIPEIVVETPYFRIVSLKNFKVIVKVEFGSCFRLPDFFTVVFLYFHNVIIEKLFLDRIFRDTNLNRFIPRPFLSTECVSACFRTFSVSDFKAEKLRRII